MTNELDDLLLELVDECGDKPRWKGRSWKNFSVENFIAYRLENFPGMTRSEIHKHDPGFYNAVHRAGFVDEVLPQSDNSEHINWQNFSEDDFKRYCVDRFSGLSRNQIRKRDAGFYQVVRKRGLLDDVMPPRMDGRESVRDWTKFNLEDLVKYRKSHYPNLGRSEILKIDSGFYGILTKRGIVDQVIPELKNGQYNDLNYCLDVARKIKEDLNTKKLPLGSKLQKMGYSGLVGAISNKHGGWIVFRKLLGENTRKPKDYWTKQENRIAEAKAAMEEQGWETFPSSEILTKNGYSTLRSAISKHEGFDEFCQLLGGQASSRKPNGYWLSLDNTITEAEIAKRELNVDRLPSGAVLVREGYSSLGVSIAKNHGGFKVFRPAFEAYLANKNDA